MLEGKNEEQLDYKAQYVDMKTEDIRVNKLSFRNKVKKAERLLGEQGLSEDYLKLYFFMSELDKLRMSYIKDIEKRLNASEKVSNGFAYDKLLLEYNSLLERNSELVAENEQLLEFKNKFSRSKKVNDELVEKVNELREKGLSTRAIAQKINISNCTVSKILNNKYLIE